MGVATIPIQLINSENMPIDPKLTVGTGQYFETIDDLLLASDILWDGLKAEDTTYGITWQIYNDGGTWKKRIYDGMFHVKVIESADIYNTGGIRTTLQGVTINEGDNVLQVGGVPQLRGLYTLTSDGVYRRHPLFKYKNDQLTNVIFIADEGTTLKNTQWVFTNSGVPTVTTDYNDGDPTNPMLWDDYFAVVPASYWQTVIIVNGQPYVENLASDISPYFAMCGYDLELASDIWGKGVSDTWLQFELVNGQTYSIQKNTDFDTHIRNVVLDATTTDIGITLPYDSFLGLTTRLTPNVEYFVQRIDSTSDHYGYLDTGSFTGNQTLPENIFKEAGDYAKFMVYQNPANVTDLTLVAHSNRMVRNYNLGTYVSDSVISDFAVPQGYNIFAIKGTITGGTEANIGIGTTSDASDILDPATNTFTNSGDIRYTWNTFTTNLSDTTQLYVKSDPDWTTNCTDVTLEICCYQDNF